MSIETDLLDILEANAGVSALIGTRIYPMLLPQTPTLPAIVYSVISAMRTARHGGRASIGEKRIQFSCWGSTYSGAKALADQVRLALDGTKPTTEGAALIAGEHDIYDTETGWFHISMDFMVQYQET